MLRSFIFVAILSLLGVAGNAQVAAIPSSTPSPTAVHTVLPPYEYPESQPIRQPRTRQDRIVSTIAPIAMVIVLVAGLYVYWLIRKGI
jgi:hypothetical protein